MLWHQLLYNLHVNVKRQLFCWCGRYSQDGFLKVGACHLGRWWWGLLSGEGLIDPPAAGGGTGEDCRALRNLS